MCQGTLKSTSVSVNVDVSCTVSKKLLNQPYIFSSRHMASFIIDIILWLMMNNSDV